MLIQNTTSQAILLTLVLHLPKAGTIYYSSSCCGDHNHKVILLLLQTVILQLSRIIK